MNILFISAVALYFIATVLHFLYVALKNETVGKISRIALWAAFISHTAFIVWRGIEAKRIPLANQFEFATGFAWGIAAIGLFFIVRRKKGMEWLPAVTNPAAFLVISYAALVPREITETMPALRSAWFGLHIGSAVFAYASFVIAGCLGIRLLIQEKKGADEKIINQTDNLSYRMICFGFLLLSVVILSGCVWAEQAWSTFWSWDPKETWALITWIIYAVYLHQRMRMKWRGRRMAWFSIIALVVVLFTFVGVNTLMSGLHSYAT